MTQPKKILTSSDSNKPKKSGVVRKKKIEPPADPQKSIRKPKRQQKRKRKHAEYGTSKLEERFMKNFLDKLGVEYIYQFKMGIIGRYADFFLPKENIIIEIDGDYYHSYGKVYEEMNPMQKHNKRVDKQKDHWCLINNIKMLRIWEHDINKSPSKVMKLLKEELSAGRELVEKQEEKKRRH